MLIIGFLLGITVSYCQEVISISGKVLDKETSLPLANASIGIKGKYIGTIANEQGEFEIHIPKDFSTDTLYISILGYWNFFLKIDENNSDQTLDVFLAPRPMILQEVVISPGLTSQEKINKSFENVTKNYPTQPFVMEGFYREIKKVNGVYVSLIEAAVDLYDRHGYKNCKVKNRHRLEDIDEMGVIRQIRKSYNFLHEELENEIGLQNNLLAYLLVQNPVKYPTRISNAKAWQENTVYLNDKIVYEIIEQLNGVEIKYYLDSDTYAVLEYSEIRKGNYFERKISDSISLKYFDMIKTVRFSSIKGMLYPKHLKLSWKVEKYSLGSHKPVVTLETDLELLLNRIDMKIFKLPSSKEKMKIYSLEWQSGKYNAAFWKNYNMIKETPLNKKIAADLEKELPLEKQFRKSNE